VRVVRPACSRGTSNDEQDDRSLSRRREQAGRAHHPSDAALHNISRYPEHIMAREGTQKKLERVRPPRVNISYDVETGGAIETKELPFLMGVLADLSGKPAEALPRLKERKFVEVTPDNFDAVLKSMTPRVQFTVENKLQPESGGKIGVDITFETLDDFNPEAVARRVGPLKELLDLRTKLADLRGSLQGNDKLDEILQNTLNDASAMKKLESEVGLQGGSDA
jgi:type VI secretion system protein ImpB